MKSDALLESGENEAAERLIDDADQLWKVNPGRGKGSLVSW